MGEIEEARGRYRERKLAAGADNRSGGEDMARRALSGLDLDLDEIVRLRDNIVSAPLEALEAGVSLHEVLLGLWVDGLATGMDLERRR